jgi:hypothetical protein
MPFPISAGLAKTLKIPLPIAIINKAKLRIPSTRATRNKHCKKLPIYKSLIFYIIFPIGEKTPSSLCLDTIT